jgi:hypothetical protein
VAPKLGYRVTVHAQAAFWQDVGFIISAEKDMDLVRALEVCCEKRLGPARSAIIPRTDTLSPATPPSVLTERG